jgi:pimeloyl-ACP methyl ester carboxylesterase
MEVPRLAHNVYRTLFDGCAADSVCSEEYPDLERVFYELADRLDAEPVSVRVRNPIDNISYQMLINGYAVRNFPFSALYSTSTIPTIPRMIYEAYEGDYDAMAEEIFFNIVSFEFFSVGMYYSVNCVDELGFRPLDDFRAADEPYPEQKDSFDSQFYFKNCQVWDVTQADLIETQPVTSDVPTLLISGEYDPITPPEYAEMAHQTLSNSYNYVFPGMGHGTSFDSPCAADILLQFVDNPAQAPDASCIADMPGVRFQRR